MSSASLVCSGNAECVKLYKRTIDVLSRYDQARKSGAIQTHPEDMSAVNKIAGMVNSRIISTKWSNGDYRSFINKSNEDLSDAEKLLNRIESDKGVGPRPSPDKGTKARNWLLIGGAGVAIFSVLLIIGRRI